MTAFYFVFKFDPLSLFLIVYFIFFQFSLFLAEESPQEPNFSLVLHDNWLHATLSLCPVRDPNFWEDEVSCSQMSGAVQWSLEAPGKTQMGPFLQLIPIFSNNILFYDNSNFERTFLMAIWSKKSIYNCTFQIFNQTSLLNSSPYSRY